MADKAGRDARRVLEQLRTTDGGHVVAHSYGANAALLAAHQEPSMVTSVSLMEPACFDLALDGARHRVQDDPRVMSALRQHWGG